MPYFFLAYGCTLSVVGLTVPIPCIVMLNSMCVFLFLRGVRRTEPEILSADPG